MKIGIIVTLLLVILLSLNASAFGVTILASDIYMAPGEVKELAVFELQNMAGEPKDITMAADVITGASVAGLLADTFFVPFGTKDVKVSMKMSVPNNAKHGDTYSIGVSFKTISAGEGKMIELSGGVENNIKVIVKEPGREEISGAVVKETGFGLSNALLGLIFLIAIAGLVYIWEKRRKG